MQGDFSKLIRWIKPPQQLKLQQPFVKAQPIKPIDNNKILYSIQTPQGKKQIAVLINDSFEISNDKKTFEDMCYMNILNEPEVLYNLIQKYEVDEIFTYIGPTLIVLNPYKYLGKYFDKPAMLAIRQLITQQNLQIDHPHVYMIAGKAYLHMKKSTLKQAIVISGQSGAGKTQSTKYCMKMLTSLSHLEQSHSIQAKILSCNPILQAFGNSKTVRNDNSSRFGKYVQIFFGNGDHLIKGANIHSYLLEKSRVVSIAKGQRSFHAFYALIASGKHNMKQPKQYDFLKSSDCYTANNINDSQYFKQIEKAMNKIGFKDNEQNKIWLLLKAILQLGNMKYDDKKHQQNEQIPCQIINKQLLKSISESLQIKEDVLQKILLVQKKIMVGNVIHKSYKKEGCIANRNTLCKAIYDAIFDFILYKIQVNLNPKDMHKYKSINILDIFGFENFQNNSFEQLCINFTNEKLLKLYNEYIFKREMEILTEDGLDINSINPPTNDQIINLINSSNGKSVSIFSIINDYTPQQQYTDQNIKDSIQTNFKNSPHLIFKKTKNLQYVLRHSQCEVEYNLNGFKMKNMDKVNQQVMDLINGIKLISTGKKLKQEKGKTLLKKFVTQIDQLVAELASSNVHFIRCIKPNQVKKPNFPDHNYILSQVRYLGVFQTIQIRKKTFPVRKQYRLFLQQYRIMFPQISQKNELKAVQAILKTLKCQKNEYMLGNKRVYVNERIQSTLNKKFYEFFKKRNQQLKKIQDVCRRFIVTSKITRNVKLLCERKKIWKKIAKKYQKQFWRTGFDKINAAFKVHKQAEKQKIKQQKAKEAQKIKPKEVDLKPKPPIQVKSPIKQTPKSTTSFLRPHDPSSKRQEQLNQKFFKYSRALIKSSNKMALGKGFSILKSANGLYKETNKNSTGSTGKVQTERVFLEESQINSNPSIFKLKKQTGETIENKPNQQNKFNESFYNQQSVYISPGAQTIFAGSMKIPLFQKTEKSMSKLGILQKILSDKYKSIISSQSGQMCSPHSQDSNFRVQNCPKEIMDKVISFPIQQFFLQVLRKRTGVFGIKKDYSEILTFKPKPLSKTLTELTPQEQVQALKIFKLLIKIGDQTILDNVFKLVDNVMRYCQQTSQSLKNQVFLQLLKQSNNESEVPAIRIYQTFSVFLHIYTPEQDFLFAALYLFFNKIAEKKHHEKQQQFLRYLFKKIVRKVQRPYGVGYMPIKYQIMALMSKRQISIPVYLPIGNNILIKAQSYETFNDIKPMVLESLGINISRIPPDFFTYFEVVNYENTELEQSPVSQNSIIWDVMTYWELAKEKYQQSGVAAPYFSIMVKIKYPYQCSYDDMETIELYFAQSYFDYSMGRIRLELKQMAMLAACIKKIKLSHQAEDNIEGCFPLWMNKVYDKQTFRKYIFDNILYLEENHLDLLQLKYKFLEICSECPLSLTFAIPTEHSLKLFMKPKRIYLVEKGIVVAEFSLREIAKWSNNNESFNFQIKKKEGNTQNKTHMIMTEYGQMCTDYLNKISQLLLKYGGRGKSNNMILNEIQ